MYKNIQTFFKCFFNILKVLQIFLFAFAFILGLKFSLDIANFQISPELQKFFDNIYNFQCLIYKPEFSGIDIDFTLIVAAFELIVVAISLKYLQEYALNLQKKNEIKHQEKNKKLEKEFNEGLKKEVLLQESEFKKFYMMYNVQMEFPQDFKELHPNFSIENEYEKYKNLMEEYIKKICVNVITAKFSSNKIAYFNIDNCDNVLINVKNFADKLKSELAKQNIKFKYVFALDVIKPSVTATVKELSKLEKILKFSKANKPVFFSSFKNRYSLLAGKKHIINSLGMFSVENEPCELFFINRSEV